MSTTQENDIWNGRPGKRFEGGKGLLAGVPLIRRARVASEMVTCNHISNQTGGPERLITPHEPVRMGHPPKSSLVENVQNECFRGRK